MYSVAPDVDKFESQTKRANENIPKTRFYGEAKKQDWRNAPDRWRSPKV